MFRTVFKENFERKNQNEVLGLLWVELKNCRQQHPIVNNITNHNYQPNYMNSWGISKLFPERKFFFTARCWASDLQAPRRVKGLDEGSLNKCGYRPAYRLFWSVTVKGWKWVFMPIYAFFSIFSFLQKKVLCSHFINFFFAKTRKSGTRLDKLRTRMELFKLLHAKKNRWHPGELWR